MILPPGSMSWLWHQKRSVDSTTRQHLLILSLHSVCWICRHKNSVDSIIRLHLSNFLSSGNIWSSATRQHLPCKPDCAIKCCDIILRIVGRIKSSFYLNVGSVTTLKRSISVKIWISLIGSSKSVLVFPTFDWWFSTHNRVFVFSVILRSSFLDINILKIVFIHACCFSNYFQLGNVNIPLLPSINDN